MKKLGLFDHALQIFSGCEAIKLNSIFSIPPNGHIPQIQGESVVNKRLSNCIYGKIFTYWPIA